MPDRTEYDNGKKHAHVFAVFLFQFAIEMEAHLIKRYGTEHIYIYTSFLQALGRWKTRKALPFAIIPYCRAGVAGVKHTQM